jgi:hypothetical protein
MLPGMDSGLEKPPGRREFGGSHSNPAKRFVLRGGHSPNQPNQYSDLGPHSRVHRLVEVDLRTKEGLIVNRLRRDLVKHVGGKPNVIQRVMIERCCWLQLRVSLLDRKIAAGEAFTEIDNNTYIAWCNALVRTMARLGVVTKRSSRPSLDTILADAGADSDDEQR